MWISVKIRGSGQEKLLREEDIKDIEFCSEEDGGEGYVRVSTVKRLGNDVKMDVCYVVTTPIGKILEQLKGGR